MLSLSQRTPQGRMEAFYGIKIFDSVQKLLLKGVQRWIGQRFFQNVRQVGQNCQRKRKIKESSKTEFWMLFKGTIMTKSYISSTCSYLLLDWNLVLEDYFFVKRIMLLWEILFKVIQKYTGIFLFSYFMESQNLLYF